MQSIASTTLPCISPSSKFAPSHVAFCSTSASFDDHLQWRFLTASSKVTRNRPPYRPSTLRSNLELFDRFDARSPRPQAVDAAAGRKGRLAPLELFSSEGQLLIEMLQNGEDISAAACAQLERLCAERRQASTYDSERKPLNDDSLYRRIADSKEKERSVAVEDIMYALMVGRMMDADVTMVETMASPACDRITGFDPENDKRLEAVQAPEVLRMIEQHVAMVILGRKRAYIDKGNFDPHGLTRIRKLKLGKIYAASVMYGYFVSKVEQRFVLERRLKEGMVQMEVEDYVGEMLEEEVVRKDIAGMRVAESLQVIERHVGALFGRPSAADHEHIAATTTTTNFPCLLMKLGVVKSLILEALALGALLREVESFVESFYPLASRA